MICPCGDPADCVDCGATTFPGATVCDECGTHLFPKEINPGAASVNPGECLLAAPEGGQGT